MADDDMHKLSCGHSCVIAAPKGMATNGPCRHASFHHLSPSGHQELLRALMHHRLRAHTLEAERDRLRAKASEVPGLSAALDEAKWESDQLRERVRALEALCRKARDAIDELMGDTDLDDDDSLAFHAMQALVDAVDDDGGPDGEA